MKIQCQQCTSKFKVPEKYYGKRIKCPKCKGPISVPSGQVQSTETAEASRPPTAPPNRAPAKVAPAPNQKFKIACQNCKAALNVPPKLIGKRVACPKCKQPVHLVLPVDQSSPPKSPTAAAEPPLASPRVAPADSGVVAKQPIDESAAERPDERDQSDQAEAEMPQPHDSQAHYDDDQTHYEDDQTHYEDDDQTHYEDDDQAYHEDDDYEDEPRPRRSSRSRHSSRSNVRGKKKGRRSRKRRSDTIKPGNKFTSTIMPIVSGMFVAIGSLLAVATVYLHFFGGPNQTTAETTDPGTAQSTTVASGSGGSPSPRQIDVAVRRSSPLAVADLKPREALVPSLKMFAGEEQPKATSFTRLRYNFIAKSEYPIQSEFELLPEPLNFRGQIHLHSKPSTSIPIDNDDDRPSYYPPETYASGLRLPKGIFLVPIGAIEFAEFVTAFDGEIEHDIIHSLRLLKRGNFRIMVNRKRPEFPRVIATNSGELNSETKGAALIWVDRNSEIHVLENLVATGYDPVSTDVTFSIPNDSVGGLIMNQAGQIAGLVSSVQNGVGTVTQIKQLLTDMRRSGEEIFVYDRLPISKDSAGKLSEAAACLVQLKCKRSQLATHAAFHSTIGTQRGEDPTTRLVFDDRYDVNFKDNGQIEHFSMFESSGCRLPAFLGLPGVASIIEFPQTLGQSNWKIEKKLKVDLAGNDRILVSDIGKTNPLNLVTQSDEYRITAETEDHLTIERKYLVKSVRNEPPQGSLQWEVPPGFPFHVEGKFVYQYDKKLKLATSIEFEGVEQKHLGKEVIAPLKLSFQMKSIPNE